MALFKKERQANRGRGSEGESVKLASPDPENEGGVLSLKGEKKENALSGALGSVKKQYLNKLRGSKALKVRAPRVSGVEASTLGNVTTIPKIADSSMHEIELQPILPNFSYVRIMYNTMANEYFYEVI